MPRIAALLTYPIDWGSALRVKVAAVGPLGMEGDRQWRVTDEMGTVLKGGPLGHLFFDTRSNELGVSAAGFERIALPSPGADAWFSRLLGATTRAAARPAEIALPLVATTTSSLARLNKELGDVVGVERFGANIVLEGTDPFEEDTWRAVRMGGARFIVTRPASTRLAFGVELRLEGTATVQLRAGQSLDVER